MDHLSISPSVLSLLLATGAFSGLLAGLFGIGGGVVIVSALIFILPFLEIPDPWVPHIAIACSLAIIVGSTLTSALTHHRHGSVPWKIVMTYTMTMIPGILFGTWLIEQMDALWIKRLFAAFLIFTAWNMFRTRRQTDVTPTWHPPRFPLLCLEGSFIGFFSAMMGVGGGVMITPILKAHGMQIRYAIGTSAACGIFIGLFGTIGNIYNGWGKPELPPYSTGFVYWPAVLCTLITSMPFAVIGARIAYHINRKILTQSFAVLLILVAIRLLTS